MARLVTLVCETGDGPVDRLLAELIGEFEALFPDCVSGYYLLGSYADGSGVGSSDLDLHVILDACSVEVQKQARDLAQSWIEKSQVELDIEFEEKAQMLGGVSPNFKYGSCLLYGDDIRAELALEPLDVWTRDRMHTSYWRTIHLFGRVPPIHLPLEYPDPHGKFYGYDRRLIRLKDGREVPCTRDLIRLVGWSATALLAWKAGVYVARKRDCHRLYKEHFADEWGQLLQEIYEKCRGRWNYLIPQVAAERQELREICARTLDFENHFLQLYRDYLLQELRSSDEPGRRQALWVLKEVAFVDDALIDAVYECYQREDGSVGELADEVWQGYMRLGKRSL